MWFQSHLGSILPEGGEEIQDINSAVSIPPWFDFAEEKLLRESKGILVSIPPWFDFAVWDVIAIDELELVSIPPWFDFALLSQPPTAP